MSGQTDNRPKRSVEYSYTESIKDVKYEDINPAGRLFGGRLMCWMDEQAGIAAMRHAGMPVTTASVDNLQFIKGVLLGDVVVLASKVTYVGNTSIEVRMDIYKEDVTTGQRVVIDRAYFTEVCLKDDKPCKVPYDLELRTESEIAEYEGAKKRIEMRKHRRVEGF